MEEALVLQASQARHGESQEDDCGEGGDSLVGDALANTPPVTEKRNRASAGSSFLSSTPISVGDRPPQQSKFYQVNPAPAIPGPSTLATHSSFVPRPPNPKESQTLSTSGVGSSIVSDGSSSSAGATPTRDKPKRFSALAALSQPTFPSLPHHGPTPGSVLGDPGADDPQPSPSSGQAVASPVRECRVVLDRNEVARNSPRRAANEASAEEPRGTLGAGEELTG